MPRPYRARKRLIHRDAAGRFRKSALRDMGLACCQKCGRLFAPDYSQMGSGFVDPRKLRDLEMHCGDCGGHEAPPAQPQSLMRIIIEESESA